MLNNLFVLNRIKSAKHSPSFQACLPGAAIFPKRQNGRVSTAMLPLCPRMMQVAWTWTASHLRPLLIQLLACLFTLQCSVLHVHYRSILASVSHTPAWQHLFSGTRSQPKLVSPVLAKDDPELLILLPLPHECWRYRHVPTYLYFI